MMARAKMATGVHLVRRFAGSLCGTAPGVADELWAESWLNAAEQALWRRLPNHDRRHSIGVARRFNSSVTERDLMAGALLHDVGKIDSGLSVFGRVAATVVGARTERFRRYLDHEQIGAEMLASARSSERTVELVAGRGPHAALLRECDDGR